MAELEAGLFSRLSNFAGLSSLVSSRIYRGMAPQKPTLPFVVMQRIDGPRMQSLGGPIGIAQPRMQFDAYATTLDGAYAVATQIRYALDGYRATVATVVVHGSTMQTESDSIEEGIEPGLRRVSMDFLITHAEATS